MTRYRIEEANRGALMTWWDRGTVEAEDAPAALAKVFPHVWLEVLDTYRGKVTRSMYRRDFNGPGVRAVKLKGRTP